MQYGQYSNPNIQEQGKNLIQMNYLTNQGNIDSRFNNYITRQSKMCKVLIVITAIMAFLTLASLAIGIALPLTYSKSNTESDSGIQGQINGLDFDLRNLTSA